MSNVGRNIRSLRIRKKITQDELAEKLFVSRQTVSNYETGRSQPDLDTLVRLAQALGTDAGALIYGERPVFQKAAARRALRGLAALVLLWALAFPVRRALFEWGQIYYLVVHLYLSDLCARPLLAAAAGWLLGQLLTLLGVRVPDLPHGAAVRRGIKTAGAVWLALILPACFGGLYTGAVLWLKGFAPSLPGQIWAVGAPFARIALYAPRLWFCLFFLAGFALWLWEERPAA